MMFGSSSSPPTRGASCRRCDDEQRWQSVGRVWRYIDKIKYANVNPGRKAWETVKPDHGPSKSSAEPSPGLGTQR